MVVCRDCGFVFVSREGFDPYRTYTEDYFRGAIYGDYVGDEPNRTKLFKEKLKLIRRYIPRSGKLLDIGCAAGFFLMVMKDMGYQTYGVEISDYAARYAQEVMKLAVFRGELQDAQFPDDFFHVITMWDVLEHLSDFLSTLTECRRIIREEGVLVAETLNVGSLPAKILRCRWHLFTPPYHLSYFSKSTLAMALDKSGFAVLNIIPVQTYVKTLGFKPIRYFGHRCLRDTLGRFLDDVILVVARPKPK
jgi:2-polyprenyl-3-methyl-5-hydroxy-6-metoxy-1,4-benzoquinol methylase